MSLKDKNVVVTGGSRGLGLGLVEALVARGARVTVVARDADALQSVRARLGVATISADVTDETAARRILAEVRPDILVLNAGAKPRMGRLDQISWADFTATWETDVKAGLYWLQAALNLPLKPGARVLVGSSGAAVNGSPLSGGYAGAKRMLWFMAKYANSVSEQKISASASRRSCHSRSSATPGSATRVPTPMRAPWASSAKSSWPASARQCRLGRSANTWSRCSTTRNTSRASPSA
jgi:NAD(P)-dependent dehydrogenase (short-subunit alcohol dehydrogenase family)